MPFRAIALDIDGTLTNDAKRITPRTLQALHTAQKAGALVVLASGRPVHGLAALAHELDLHVQGGLLVAYNGACVVDAQTHEVLYRCALGIDDVRAVLEHMRTFDVIPWIVQDNRLCIERGARRPIIHRGHELDIVEYERAACDLEIFEVDDLISWCHEPQEKVLVAGTDTYLQDHCQMMAKPFDHLSCMFTADFYFEYMAQGVDKGSALIHAFDRLGIDMDDVIAFGDAENDLAMIRAAGMGVAMGNATPEVKRAATEVTASNNEDGIALVLERFFS